jgi:hypothetical protein
MLTESNVGATPQANPGLTHLTLDGVHKTIAGGVTGYSLHLLAGFPEHLSVDGDLVENNDKSFEVKPGMKFVTAPPASGFLQAEVSPK